ncbi:hypothetical protein CBR_g50785 [Chara braunii]|uniref:TF-B3 domain-containing protein n=1 Tax=Chara braunii TaxID=69332 RepID=A0A388K5V7_CHABU|nr:hypothetical protein CBR_g50785 [Chara braunii]|eukprot:GBG65425.1 hypothetical protein CBR_g50785 [Chara braunii]
MVKKMGSNRVKGVVKANGIPAEKATTMEMGLKQVDDNPFRGKGVLLEDVVESLVVEGKNCAKLLQPAHVERFFILNLPSEFSRLLPRSISKMWLEDSMGNAWTSRFLGSKRGILSGGWRAFAKDHGLVPNDWVILEKLSDTRLKVSIFRSGGKPPLNPPPKKNGRRPKAEMEARAKAENSAQDLELLSKAIQRRKRTALVSNGSGEGTGKRRKVGTRPPEESLGVEMGKNDAVDGRTEKGDSLPNLPAAVINTEEGRRVGRIRSNRGKSQVEGRYVNQGAVVLSNSTEEKGESKSTPLKKAGGVSDGDAMKKSPKAFDLLKPRKTSLVSGQGGQEAEDLSYVDVAKEGIITVVQVLDKRITETGKQQLYVLLSGADKPLWIDQNALSTDKLFDKTPPPLRGRPATTNRNKKKGKR